jgi:hypothetical protein
MPRVSFLMLIFCWREPLILLDAQDELFDICLFFSPSKYLWGMRIQSLLEDDFSFDAEKPHKLLENRYWHVCCALSLCFVDLGCWGTFSCCFRLLRPVQQNWCRSSEGESSGWAKAVSMHLWGWRKVTLTSLTLTLTLSLNCLFLVSQVLMSLSCVYVTDVSLMTTLCRSLTHFVVPRLHLLPLSDSLHAWDSKRDMDDEMVTFHQILQVPSLEDLFLCSGHRRFFLTILLLLILERIERRILCITNDPRDKNRRRKTIDHCLYSWFPATVFLMHSYGCPRKSKV